MDERISALIGRVVRDHMQVRPQERVLVTWDLANPDAIPYVRTACEVILAQGADAWYKPVSPYLAGYRVRNGSDWLLQDVSPLEMVMYDANHQVEIRADDYTDLSIPVNPERSALRSQALSPLYAKVARIDRMVLQLPGPRQAARLGMTEQELLTVFLRACTPDWAWIRDTADVLTTVLVPGAAVRIQCGETDLAMTLHGKAVPCIGRRNMPDGEVYATPVASSVCGRLSIPERIRIGSGWVKGLSLQFEHGQVISAAAAEGEEILAAVLAHDDGARRLGEFGIGLNPGVEALTGNITFDEKMFGSIHVALGYSYAASGTDNQSAGHDDLVLDMRHPASALLVGDRCVMRDGRLLVD